MKEIDPDTTSWAVGVLTIMVGWFGKVMHGRVTRLERKTITSEQAAKERAMILANQRALSSRMDTQHNILVSRIDELYKRYHP